MVKLWWWTRDGRAYVERLPEHAAARLMFDWTVALQEPRPQVVAFHLERPRTCKAWQ